MKKGKQASDDIEDYRREETAEDDRNQTNKIKSKNASHHPRIYGTILSSLLSWPNCYVQPFECKSASIIFT